MFVSAMVFKDDGQMCIQVCSNDKSKIEKWIEDKKEELGSIVMRDKNFGILEIPEI